MSIFRVINLCVIMLACCGCSGNRSAHTTGENQPRAGLYDKLHAYWDDVDADRLSDDALEQKIVDFLYLAAHLDPAERETLWPDFYRHIPGHPHRTIVDYLGQSDSPLYSPDLLEEYLANLMKYTDDPAAQTRAEYLLTNLRKNPVGSKIADLKLREGTRSTTLHRLISEADEACLIIFYDPDCTACEAFFKQMDTQPADSLKAIAVSITDTTTPQTAPRSPIWKTAAVRDKDELDQKFYHPTLPALYRVTKTAIIQTRP